MTKILLAPDKFRGSLTAVEVCQAMREGIGRVLPEAEIIALPMADGGEGTAEILTLNAGGKMYSAQVANPLGSPTEATYGLSANKHTAFIEMATASGSKLLQNHERNPLKTNTYGTGELIEAAAREGARHVVLGIGGSATNDGGIGMAAALGWQFLDVNGQPLPPTAEYLAKIEQIVPPTTPLPLTVEVACDVNAPLCGSMGASYIYGPQKGATPEMVAILDAGLRHLADVIARDFGRDLAQVPGAGAAGGLGFGAMFFLNATLKEGVKIVMEQTHFDQHLPGTSLILTGEGKIDEQTLQGKLIAGIAQAGQQHGVPTAAVCGTLLASPQQLQQLGLIYATSIITRPMSLEEALQTAHQGVADAVCHLLYFFINR